MELPISRETIPQIYVGIDISKDHLDVCVLPGNQNLTFDNDANGLDQLTERLILKNLPLWSLWKLLEVMRRSLPVHF